MNNKEIETRKKSCKSYDRLAQSERREKGLPQALLSIDIE